MDKKYMDIINLDYKPSLKHPRMPRQNRACQFQAFKALRGYEERIYESSKEKIKKHLASDQKDLINYRLSEIISGKIKKIINLFSLKGTTLSYMESTKTFVEKYKK